MRVLQHSETEPHCLDKTESRISSPLADGGNFLPKINIRTYRCELHPVRLYQCSHHGMGCDNSHVSSSVKALRKGDKGLDIAAGANSWD